MKPLIVSMMALLWVGNITARAEPGGYLQALLDVGVRSSIGVLLLLFLLLLLVDIGLGTAAVLLAAIVTFSYLTEASERLSRFIDGILNIGV